jgi:hypothetical protein
VDVVFTLELELAAVLGETRFTDRQARALTVRLGWDGGGGTTLAGAAAAVGYTRERVRQLEQRLRRELPQATPALPLTRRALGLIEGAAPARTEAIAGRLAEAGVAERPFHPRGVLCAATLAGVDTAVRERGAVVLGPRDLELGDLAVLHARRLTRHRGAVELAELAASLAGAAGDLHELARLLELRPEVLWLDPQRAWLTVPGREAGLTRALRKMLALSPSLTIAEIDDGLRRSLRPIRLPREVLRALCESIDWIELDRESDTVSAAVPLDPRRYLTPLERDLIALVGQAGPVVDFGRTMRLAEEAGLNRTSVGIYLCRSPLLTTVGRGRYALRRRAIAA